MFYIAWTGNKRKEFKYLKDLFNVNDFNRIIEPFCGSCSFSFNCNKEGFKGKYLMNDKDKKLIEFLKDVKKNGSKKYFEFCQNRLKDLTKEKHNEFILNKDKNIKEWFYYNKCYNFRKGLYPDQIKKKVQCIYNHEKYDKFIKRCNFENKDFKDILYKYDDEKTLIFLDPPYFDSFNANYVYYNKNGNDENYFRIDNTKMYIDILEWMEKTKCKFILIINKNAITYHLYKKWFKLEYIKQYNLTKKSKNDYFKSKSIHMVITNI